MDRTKYQMIGGRMYCGSVYRDICRIPAGTGSRIFKGPEGVGKYHAALWLAGKVLRTEKVCLHPDYMEISPVKGCIGIDQMQGLFAYNKVLPVTADLRICVIREAQVMTDSAQNAILKLLEEGTRTMTVLFLTTEPLLPTIESRSMEICFPPIPWKAFSEYMGRKLGKEPDRLALALADGCEGFYEELVTEETYLSDVQAMLDWLDTKELPAAQLFETLHLMAEKDKDNFFEAYGLVFVRAWLKLLLARVFTPALECYAGADGVDAVCDPHRIMGRYSMDQVFLIVQRVTGNAPEAVRIVREQLSAGRNPQLLISDCMDIVADSVPASVAGVYPDTGTAHYNRLLKRLVEAGSGQIFCALAEGFMDVTASLGRNADDSMLLCGIIRLVTAKRAAVSVLEKRVADLEEMVKRGIFTGQEEPSAPFVEDDKAQDEEILPDASGAPEETFLQDADCAPDERAVVDEDCVGDERPVPVLERADDDIWEMFLAQSFRGDSGKEAQKAPEACSSSRMLPANRPMPGGGMAEALQTLYEDPLLESVLALGFRQESTPDGPVMETDMEPVYRVAAAYHAAKGFPFAIRMKQPA